MRFNQLHAPDGGRIRYRKVCEVDEKEVPPQEITKGYEAADGRTVTLTDRDLADLPLPTARTIEVAGFIATDEVDPLQLSRPYYLAAADAAAAKPYTLMREALRRSGKAAVAKLAMRGRETLALLRVHDDVLVLHTLLWPDEINPAAGVAPTGRVSVTDAELDLADTLINALGDTDLSEFTDNYGAAVEQLVAAKLEGTVLPEPSREPAGGKVIDLMAALEESVAAARETRGEAAPADAPAPRKRAAASGARKEAHLSAAPEPESGTGGAKKRTAARKTATRKAPAKKAPAKRTKRSA